VLDNWDMGEASEPIGPSYRLFSLALVMGAWVLWGAAVVAAHGVGWSRANGPAWFAVPIAVAVVIAVAACLGRARRWHTVSVAADGSALELRSLCGTEAVELARPVGLRIYHQTFPVVDPESGHVGEGRRSDLFITSAGRSTVVSAPALGGARRREREERLERFAHDVAARLGTGAPAVEEVDAADGRGHRRHDPATRWVNGGHAPEARTSRLAVLVAAPLVAVLSWTALPAALTRPASPDIVGASEVDAELATALDDLEGDVGHTGSTVPATGGTGVQRHPCERDHEWLWGSVGASRLTATAQASVSSATAATLRQALGRIASPSLLSENTWYFPGKVGAGAMTPGQPRFRVAVDGSFLIRIDATDIEVTATTDCVDDEDLDRLQPTLAEHTRRAADALAGAS